MRFKAIPPAPENLDALEDAWRALGLVPAVERSCCQRISDRRPAVDPDEARRWLALMRALEIVERGPSGYTRTRTFPEEALLRRRFRERVFGVGELLEAGRDAPLTVERAFAAIEPHVPPWERHRAPEMWRDRWRDRVDHLLAWGQLFGVFQSDPDGYRPSPNVIGDTES